MLLAVDAGNTNIVFAPVATGGLAAMFDTHTSAFDAIEPDLTLSGLAPMHQRLAAPFKDTR